MRLIDADRLLSNRMKSKYYHLPNGDIAIPIIDIEHAPTVNQWIPCGERLPEKVGKYLVTAKPTYSHSKEITKAYWSGGRWLGYCRQEILAWMPLPEVYMEVEHD